MTQVVENRKINYLDDIPNYYRGNKTMILWSVDSINNDEDSNINNEDFFTKSPLKYIKTPISFAVADTDFVLPYDLSHIKNAITKSESILKLKENWDEEGALPTDKKTFLNAIRFIIKYSSYLLESKEKTVLDYPDISILRDGAIAVNWETKNASFTIIFEKDDKDVSYYYAKEKNSFIPLRYGVNIKGDIDKTTAIWMSENLKYNQGNPFR